MCKLLIFLAAIVLCAGCENYQADIEDYLSYWSTQAAIVQSGFDPAITVRTDKDTIQSIPSSSNVTVTFIVRNPKKISFKLPGQPTSPADIVVFPTDVAGTTTSSPKQPDDYELTQDSYSQLTLTYKKEFLQKHEYGKKNIGSTITLYAKDGRKFSETFKLNVKANTPPPNLIYRAIGKTATADVNGKHYYVLFLEVSGMDTEINGSDLLHKDIAQLSIAKGSGSYTSIPLTVKADKSGFDINGAGGRLLEYSNAVALELVDVESGVTPDILPASTEKWILCVKTDVEVRGAVKQYRFRLQDEAGLFSEDELVASTSINKVSPVHIDVQTGNWTTTMKSGSEADPHEIVYQPGTGKVLLRVSTATTGATVYYKLERNSSVVSKSSGQTPQTIELPAVPDAVYKLTVWAEKEGFENSPEEVVCYKTKRNDKMEISAGQNAWGQLKAAVAVAEDGDSIFINGTIKATSADGNSGAIEVTKSITIKGKNGNTNIDMLDANKSGLGASVHRIFKVNSGTLTLENLTLKNGKAAGGGEAGNGGAMLIESGGTLTMTGCVVQECTAAANGGGILNKGTLTMNHGRIESNEANAGGGIYNTGTLTIHTGSISANTATNNGGGIYNEGTLIINNGIIGKGTSGYANQAANSGGGIFLYEGACTLNGTKIQENTIGSSGKGSGIYLHQPNGAALTITGTTQIGSRTDTNTLCLGAQTSQSAFVTAKDLRIMATRINIEPQNYDAQKNTTLVKLPNGNAATYKDCFYLTEAGSLAEGWVLISNDDDKELVLKKGTAISNVDYAWESLKDAITEAEAGDTIVVEGEITATTDFGAYGEISVTKSITIRGNKGCAYDILDANKEELGSNAHRIFNVTGSDTKLTLENIALKNGKAAGTGDDGMGGGIYCKGIKELTIKGCVIMDCEANIEGGGIYVAASGGVNTKAVITETIISRNTAGLRGGGIAFNPSNVTSHITGVLDSVTVQGNSLTNTAPNTNNGGAGVFFSGGYNDSSEYTVKGGTITGNNAGVFNGGGIYIKTSSSGYVNGTLTLKDGTRISGNSAENGGGVAVKGSKLFMEGSITAIGGADADRKNTAVGYGGGVHVQNGIFTMSGGKITGNHARRGGGVYGMKLGNDKGEIIIKGSSEISENTATMSGTLAGGGIGADYKLTVTDSVRIERNHAPNGFGGGIACGNDTQFDFTGGTVTGNTAGDNGKGVYISHFNTANTYFKMSGSVKVDEDNDVFLGGSNASDYAYITVIGALEQDSTAKLTMNDSGYIEGRAVVKGGDSYTLTAEDTRTFTVTPGGSPSQNWYVGSDGKLTTTPP